MPLNTYNKNKSNIAVTTYYTGHQDLYLSDDTQSTELPASLDIEFTLRIHSIFNAAINVSKYIHDEDSATGSLAAERQAFGFGLKIDLPGIFFARARGSLSRREGKRWPFNSFLYGTLQRVNTTNASSVDNFSMAMRYGFGLDTFLFNDIAYLSFYFGGFQFETNTFLQTGVGIGVTL